MVKVVRILILFFIIFLSTQLLYGDIIYLKNGIHYEGKILKETSDDVTVEIGIGTMTIAKKDVSSIEKEKEKEITDNSFNDKKILEELRKVSMKIKSYRCETETKLYDNSTMKGTLSFKAPNKMRANYIVKLADTSMETMKVLFVSDGEVFWIYYPQMNIAYKYNVLKLSSIVPGKEELLPSTAIEKIIKNNSYKILGEGTINNDMTYRVETNVPGYVMGLENMNSQKEITKCRLWLRGLDGFLVRNIGYSDENEVIFINQNVNIRTNIKISDSEFEFEVPKGVNVLEPDFQ